MPNTWYCWSPTGPAVMGISSGFLSSPIRLISRTRSLPSSTSAWLKLMDTCGATSLSATCTVSDAEPTMS